MTGHDLSQPSALENLAILHELDLGCHTLFLMSDGSIDLLANDEQTPYVAENMLHLDSDETYRLYISLHEQFKEQQARMEQERGGPESEDEGISHAVGRTACH
jgi:hypothetical protein